MKKNPSRYEDIIHLPHPVSKTRKRMSRYDRAAQFSPFAALVGYDAAIREEARLTSGRRELAEDALAALDRKYALLAEHRKQAPWVEVVWFREDDRNTRLLLRAVLQAENYTVFTAENGEDALEVMDREHIDLVVLDVMMPKMDGYEFTRILRQTDNNLPILMVSARQMPADKRQGFLVGTDDYITKPIDEVEMLLRIKALLRRARIASERRIVLGEVVLDYDSFTVSRGGETQELPQKEFLLLYKLLSYPGKIFTRIQLMDEIWGADSDTGWETVTVHIGRLRKRFESWPEFEIVSVRGLGYKAVKKV